MHRQLHRLYLFIEKNKSVSAVFMVLLFATLLLVASKVEFNEDIARFIPKSSQNKTLQKVLASTKFNDNIVVHFKDNKSSESENLTNYAKRFLDSLNLNAEHHIENIQGFVEEGDIFEILDFAYQHTPIYLKDQDYKIISDKLNSDSITYITENNYKSLISTSGIARKDLILKDPLAISIIALKNFNPLGFNKSFILKHGFVVSKDEKHLLLFIKTKNISSSNFKIEELIDYLYKLRTNFYFADNTIEIDYFGGPFIASANSKQIKSDLQFTVGIAIIVLLLFFVFFYKKITIPILLIIPTLFGALLGICALYLLRQQVSAISLGIGALLLGVTLDYALHILTHIRSGLSIPFIYKALTKPILMSSLTTALAFLCLLFIDSQALQDLGIFASVSVLGASVFALIFIPQTYHPKEKILKSITFLDRIAAYEFHKNKILVASILLLTIICGFTYSKVEFNKDLSTLNFITPELLKAESSLDSLTNETSKTLYISAYGENFEEVLETNDNIEAKLANLKVNNTIESYSSLASLYKSTITQNKDIIKWKRFWHNARKDSLRENLINAGKKFGFKETAFQEFYNYLDKGFVPISYPELEVFGFEKLGNFYSKSEGFSTITSIVKVDNSKMKSVISAFPNTNNYILIDRQAMNESLLSNLKNDFNSLILYCAIIVIGVILLFYRNIRLTIITIIPILITWIITIGIMGIFGLDFNIFNIIISSFIFGLGIDYSIFISNGMLNKMNRSNLDLATNKTSILLSVITTILGVGVMIFAKHPALKSIALISVIGILTAMVVAFAIQPLLFNYLIKNKYEQD